VKWVHEGQGQDRVDEIGCFAGLEGIATNPSTLATNHLAFKKQLSSMLMSALDENVKFDF
jgi:hypothetical protein